MEYLGDPGLEYVMEMRMMAKERPIHRHYNVPAISVFIRISLFILLGAKNRNGPLPYLNRNRSNITCNPFSSEEL